MILDLGKFIAEGQPFWSDLEEMLDKSAKDPGYRMELAQARRFHYLYQRASADLVRMMTFSAQPEIRTYLESLVERAYSEIHETRKKPHRFRPFHWFTRVFPGTFRIHVRAFWLSVIIMLVGGFFGGLAITFDPEAKEVLMPFSHLAGNPSDRVAMEEKGDHDRLAGRKGRFSSYLMTHNTRVSILVLAMGLTFGVGTVMLLFYNGIILGAVVMDYVLAGESVFLAGWLLPHGSIEIPAILMAGQAGLVLARAMIGWSRPQSFKTRLRQVTGDLVTLIFGVALLLIWAGIIEAFLSQYHEPVIPYAVKIGFGAVQLLLLAWFLAFSGKNDHTARPVAGARMAAGGQ